MIDYVFWLTDSSERVALHYAERVKKKFRTRGFFSTVIRIKEDFTLIDYKPEELEAFLEFRDKAIIAYMENKELVKKFEYEMLNLGSASTGNETDELINKQIEQYKAEHENIVEKVPCQTAHCGRCKLHFDFGKNTFPIVPYRYLPQAFSGITADCRSLI